MYLLTRIFSAFIKNPLINTLNMLPLSSSRIFFRRSDLFFLLVLIYFLLVSGLPVEAQASIEKTSTPEEASKTLAESLEANPWTNIKGFRSAKFGMNEKSVFRAIDKDFKLGKSEVKKDTNPVGQNTFLSIMVPDLFRTGGTANVVYILGHKSKKLVHVNVLWGKGATENVDGKGIVDTANLLRNHFLKKQYKEEGLVANGRMSDVQTVVFRGRDKKDRMVLLLLNTQAKQEGQTDEQVINNTSLVLSYISNPDKPDVRDISIKDDEF